MADTQPRLKDALRQAWSLAAPFWRNDRAAWWQLAAVVAATLSLVWINVRFSAWNNTFYDALQAHDMPVFRHQLGVFAGLAAAAIALAVARLVMQQRLLIHWRERTTEELLARWLQPGTPYRLDTGALDNPDQRIAEDVRAFAVGTLGLALGLLDSCVTLLSFIAILWHLSGSLRVPWPAPGWSWAGYLVWIAIAYSAAGSWIVRRLGAPLVPTNALQQRVEADFRYALVQVRDHAEAIALARGEIAERRRLHGLFAAIRANWYRLIGLNKRLTGFSAGYAQVAIVFPLLAAAPRYFAGQIQLGGLMQTAQAFGQVQGALSWFVDAYGSLADWQATVLRLAAFRDRLSGVADRGAATDALPDRHRHAAAVQANHLAVAPNGGPVLLEVPALSVAPGEWLLITGPSGSGKSSLLRTLAGLWRPARGSAHVAPDAVFVPQRPWLPHGTLADILAYPQAADAFDVERMKLALHHAELDALVPSLLDGGDWARRLSPGEQQRLQIGRLFLQRPACIVLDEATSALDAPAQERLLRRLRAALPHAAVLHVGHRQELRALHDRAMHVVAGQLVAAPHSRAAMQVNG